MSHLGVSFWGAPVFEKNEPATDGRGCTRMENGALRNGANDRRMLRISVELCCIWLSGVSGAVCKSEASLPWPPIRGISPVCKNEASRRGSVEMCRIWVSHFGAHRLLRKTSQPPVCKNEASRRGSVEMCRIWLSQFGAHRCLRKTSQPRMDTDAHGWETEPCGTEPMIDGCVG